MGAIHLYLVRHGESVDNVANLYAGSRDAPLTSHGVLQARRLGTHLSSRTASAPVTHIFASNLQRAFRTAEAIRDALSNTSSEAEASTRRGFVEVVQLPELREKHFGSGEGQKFGARSVGERHAGAETHEAMFARAKRFVNDYLTPIFACVDASEEESESVVVVAHGIILGVLARVLCSTSYFGTVVPSTEDRLPLAWSNTGYVEIHIMTPAASTAAESTKSGPTPTWPDLSIKTIAVNCTDHLQGLKKTRGGIGSAKHDEKQKTLNAFFTPTAKKRSHDDEA